MCHFAGQISVQRSMQDPIIDAETNVIGSLNLLQNCVKYGVRKVVYTSSGGAIYGDPAYLPCDEAHPVQPLSHYGVSKYAVEKYLYVFRESFGLDYTALRLGNVYGPRQDPLGEAGVVAIFSRAMLDGRPVTINGSGGAGAGLCPRKRRCGGRRPGAGGRRRRGLQHRRGGMARPSTRIFCASERDHGLRPGGRLRPGQAGGGVQDIPGRGRRKAGPGLGAALIPGGRAEGTPWTGSGEMLRNEIFCINPAFPMVRLEACFTVILSGAENPKSLCVSLRCLEARGPGFFAFGSEWHSKGRQNPAL